MENWFPREFNYSVFLPVTCEQQRRVSSVEQDRGWKLTNGKNCLRFGFDEISTESEVRREGRHESSWKTKIRMIFNVLKNFKFIFLLLVSHSSSIKLVLILCENIMRCHASILIRCTLAFFCLNMDSTFPKSEFQNFWYFNSPRVNHTLSCSSLNIPRTFGIACAHFRLPQDTNSIFLSQWLLQTTKG